MSSAEKEIHESEKNYPELSEAGKEYVKIIKSDKLQLWDENKRLKAALRKAAEIVASSYCPANYDCPLEEAAFGNGSDTECTQERAEMCWMEHWMGEGRTT